MFGSMGIIKLKTSVWSGWRSVFVYVLYAQRWADKWTREKIILKRAGISGFE